MNVSKAKSFVLRLKWCRIELFFNKFSKLWMIPSSSFSYTSWWHAQKRSKNFLNESEQVLCLKSTLCKKKFFLRNLLFLISLSVFQIFCSYVKLVAWLSDKHLSIFFKPCNSSLLFFGLLILKTFALMSLQKYVIEICPKFGEPKISKKNNV